MSRLITISLLLVARTAFAQGEPDQPQPAPVPAPEPTPDAEPAPEPTPDAEPAPEQAPAPEAEPATVAEVESGGEVEAKADEPTPELVAEGQEEIEIVGKAPPGAHAELSKEQLEREELDDIHKVLRNVAGVYLRDEDGYGLRPNIGMRGAAAERSAKITMMEDGVLITPAPYTAPAAYYTPLVTRMSRIEVTKGPSAVKFGPNTVGGAIDMISEPFPASRAGYVDLAGGSDMYGKLHARAAEKQARWGVMAEYVKLRSDGFKELDSGGPTGFDKNDFQLTTRYNSDPAASDYHVLELRAGFADETSKETYIGLTDADFAAKPQRRYVASALDEMSWKHWRMRATHKVELGLHTRVETIAYRHKLQRAWGKVDGFIGQRDFSGLLARPMAGANQVFYSILTGQADSTSLEEQLILGTNDRTFTSQGVQSVLRSEQSTGPIMHHVDAGVRVHFDRADRRRYEDSYSMLSGSLVRTDRDRATVINSRAETIALAAFASDKLTWNRVEVTSGVRVELINYRFLDYLTTNGREGDYAVFIPGIGGALHITDEVSALAGVHRGFVPVAPSANAGVKPESSVNYEAGARWQNEHINADLIGFFSDYSNLKGSCTLSAGCTDAQDGMEFNGGKVFAYGVEAQLGGELTLHKRTKMTLPVNAAYTLTRSSFQQNFSSDFGGWGDVKAGDQLPYLPEHLLSVSTGLKLPRYELGATARYQGETRDVAGQGPIPDQERLGSLFTIDLNAHARLHDYAELYVTCSNLLDEQVIISRRPYGARPNPPRMFALGYKARF